ncbi:PrsW family intramembrane metalloprotease [Corynebacterium heidelbergense]|uniref:PrsW family intramembrane metalloprotease n=1 Tax=Corynebacterium heidelbergense TaxID=2055947 RepID=A0A364V3V6_9CORY|nr:PrsW family intramembrane metalloprotease [Corynebacterium heidelbergense]RAV31296.1 hypothetical protein DLJ54_09115 [Corynebacterium heidelbergense]
MTASLPNPSTPVLPSQPREFFHPRMPLWWLYCASVCLGGVGIVLDAGPTLLATKIALWSVAPVFVVSTAVFCLLIVVCDRFRARRMVPLAAGFGFGATAAVWLALRGNNHLRELAVRLLTGGQGAAPTSEDAATAPSAVAEAWADAFTGPVTEEWIKTLGILLVLLISRHTLTRPIHGLLLGGAVGLGFQVVENVVYAAVGAMEDANSDLSGALSVGLLRSVVGVSSHWMYSAVIGVGLAVLLGLHVPRDRAHPWSRGRRWLVFLALFALGFGMHFAWNAPTPSLLMPVKMLVFGVLFVFLVRWVWGQERRFLGDATPTQRRRARPAFRAHFRRPGRRRS